MNQIEVQITELYQQFMADLAIHTETGILGKISNQRYTGESLRFSGFPYIGSAYQQAKKKILFVGMDIGIDELREEKTYHSIPSRRECIVHSPEKSIQIGYNNHISGTYAIALYLLKELYGWENYWEMIYNNQENTFLSIVNGHQNTLPVEVLDYVALTNVHKFVTECRGCDLKKENPVCKKDSCIQTLKNRSGDWNRKWYNEKEEIDFFIKEVHVFNPDILYFQGSNIFNYDALKRHFPTCEIWVANHPSAWNVGANKSSYIDSSRIKRYNFSDTIS